MRYSGLWGIVVLALASTCLAGAQEQPQPSFPPAGSPAQKSPSPAGAPTPAEGASKAATEDKESKGPAATGKPMRTPKEEAWHILESACKGNRVSNRATAIRVLGLLPNDPKARKLAEDGLTDDKLEVRTAAATALGDMMARASIPKLKKALDDKEAPVALAAAHALDLMHDPAAFEVYYEILSGDRKASRGLIASETAILKDKKKMAELGFEEGIGFIPFAGIGWGALKTITKDDSSPIRAAAAKVLAKDPDPASTKVLDDATGDKSWLVRAAALEALAKRGNPESIDAVALYMSDEKIAVKYTAAAAVLRLARVKESRGRAGIKKTPK